MKNQTSFSQCLVQLLLHGIIFLWNSRDILLEVVSTAESIFYHVSVQHICSRKDSEVKPNLWWFLYWKAFCFILLHDCYRKSTKLIKYLLIWGGRFNAEVGTFNTGGSLMFKLWRAVIKTLPIAGNSLEVKIVHTCAEGSTDLGLAVFTHFIQLTYEKLAVLPLNPVPN